MALTAADLAEIKDLDAKQAATGTFSPEDLAEMEALDAPKEFTLGEQATDVGRSALRANQESAEFLADTAGFVIPTYNPDTGRVASGFSERFNKGIERGGESEEGLWKTMKAFGSGFMEPTEGGKITERMFRSPEFLDEQISEEEGSTALNMAKKAAELTVELGTTSFMGGAKAAPMVARTLPGSVALGTAGEQVGGEWGEMGGVITGALAGDVKSLVQLAKMLYTKTAGGVAGVGGAILDTAQPWRSTADKASKRDTRLALTQLIANRTGNKDLPADFQAQLEGLVDQLQPHMDELGTAGQRLDDTGLQFAEREGITGPGTAVRERQLELESINEGMRDEVLTAAGDMTPSGAGIDIAEAGIVPGQTARAEVAAGRAGAETEAQALIDAQAGPLAQSRQMETDALAAQQAAATRQQADVAARGDTRTVDASKGVADELGLAKSRAKAVVDDAYALVPGGDTVTAEQLTTAMAKYKRGLKTASDKMDLEENFPKTIKRIAKLTAPDAAGNVANLTSKDVSSIISLLSGEAFAIKQATGSNSALLMVPDMKKALYEALGEGSEARKEAAALFAKYDSKWGRKTDLGKALDKDPQLAGDKLIGGAGDTGVVTLQDTLREGGPAVAKEAEAHMIAQFNAASNKKSFVARNKAKLDLLPGAKAQIDESIAATGAGDEALTSLTAAQKDVGKGEVALTRAEVQADALRAQGAKDVEKIQSKAPTQFSSVGQNEVDMVAAAHRQLKTGESKDRLANITALVESTGGDPVALQRLQKTFMRDLVDQIDDGKLTKSGLKYFQDNKDVLEKSGMFNADELAKLEDSLQSSQKVFMHTDTAQLNKLPKRANRVAEALVSVVGATAGSTLLSANKLVGSSIGSKFLGGWFRKLTSEKIDSIMYDLTFHPEKIGAAVERVRKKTGGDVSQVEFEKILEDLAAGAFGAARTAAIGE